MKARHWLVLSLGLLAPCTLAACSSASFGGGGGGSMVPAPKPAASADAKPAGNLPGKPPAKPASAPAHGTLGTAAAGQAAGPTFSTVPAVELPTGTDGGSSGAATAPDPACQSLPAGSLIDFEDLGGAGEGTSVSDQYASSHGVTFSLEGGGSPELIAIDGEEPAWLCSSFDCSSRLNGTRPGENLGHWAITSGRDDAHTSTALVITYSQPVDEASGMIIDVDRGETYTVEARDASGNVVDTETLQPTDDDPQAYDGRGMTFQIQRGGRNDVASIRLQGSKVAWAGGIGLAFDNFSPSKACH